MKRRFRQFRSFTTGGSVLLAALLCAGDGTTGVAAAPAAAPAAAVAAPQSASDVLGRLRGLSAWLDSGHRSARSAVTLGLRN